jgi:hypothetical protein
MPKLKRLNQRQEIFAQGIACGLSGVEAFKRATPGNPKDCDVKAHKMRWQPLVAARIEELIRENERESAMVRKEFWRENARKNVMTREQLLNFYTEAILTPADRIPPGSPVIQNYERTEHGEKIRIVDKAAAGAALSKLCGWNEAEKVEITADSLNAYIVALRNRPIGGEIIEGEVCELENGQAPCEEPDQPASE